MSNHDTSSDTSANFVGDTILHVGNSSISGSARASSSRTACVRPTPQTPVSPLVATQGGEVASSRRLSELDTSENSGTELGGSPTGQNSVGQQFHRWRWEGDELMRVAEMLRQRFYGARDEIRAAPATHAPSRSSTPSDMSVCSSVPPPLPPRPTPCVVTPPPVPSPPAPPPLPPWPKAPCVVAPPVPRPATPLPGPCRPPISPQRTFTIPPATDKAGEHNTGEAPVVASVLGPSCTRTELAAPPTVSPVVPAEHKTPPCTKVEMAIQMNGITAVDLGDKTLLLENVDPRPKKKLDVYRLVGSDDDGKAVVAKPCVDAKSDSPGPPDPGKGENEKPIPPSSKPVVTFQPYVDKHTQRSQTLLSYIPHPSQLRWGAAWDGRLIATTMAACMVAIGIFVVGATTFWPIALGFPSGAILAWWGYRQWLARRYSKAARRFSKELVYNTPNPEESLGCGTAWQRYWARRLRAEMNYPTTLTVANKQVACNKLDSLWREEAPDLRAFDAMRARPIVVAYAFVPGKEEVDAHRVAASAHASKLRSHLSGGMGF
jgi:hypothetical protein